MACRPLAIVASPVGADGIEETTAMRSAFNACCMQQKPFVDCEGFRR
jgi:hypothetical protein